MASGFSLRGLSSVITTRSAWRAAAAAISGRLPRSRSPPQPNTQHSLPAVWARGRQRTVVETVLHALGTVLDLVGPGAAVGVVAIDHHGGQFRTQEQAVLGRGVAGDVAVIVQVIATDVGQHGDIEFHAGCPIL